jgi:A32 protein
MINLYETKAVKKFLPKKNNPSFKATQMELNSRILVVGASGSGKTNWLGNYLVKAKDTFNMIHIVYKESEAIYDMLREQFKKKVVFYNNPGELPTLKEMRKDKDGKEDEEDNVLLIIDDWVDQAHKYANMNDIFLRGRRYVTTIFISQSYFKVPKFWRSQLTYIILIRLSGDKDLKLVLSDYSLGLEAAELLALFKQATKEKFHFFKLDVNSSDNNRKYSNNWADFFQLEN